MTDPETRAEGEAAGAPAILVLSIPIAPGTDAIWMSSATAGVRQAERRTGRAPA